MPLAQVTTPAPSDSIRPTEYQLAVRKAQLRDMTICVAANSHSSADAIEWRDMFCHDCDVLECLKGTAEQLAAKVIGLEWIVENAKTFDAICPACVEVFG